MSTARWANPAGLSSMKLKRLGLRSSFSSAPSRAVLSAPRLSARLVCAASFGNTQIAESMIVRPARYNQSKQRLLELEKQGQAQLFFPEDMQVTSTERNVMKLRSN